MNAKYSVGQHVTHPDCPDGFYFAGSGTITSVNQEGNEFTYKLRCDKTGNELPTFFKESQLTAY